MAAARACEDVDPVLNIENKPARHAGRCRILVRNMQITQTLEVIAAVAGATAAGAKGEELKMHLNSAYVLGARLVCR